MRTTGLMVMLLGAAGLGACGARSLLGHDADAAFVAPDDAGTHGDSGQGSDARDAANPDALTTGPRLLLQPVELWYNSKLYPCGWPYSSLPSGNRHVVVALVRQGLTIVRTVQCTDDSLDLGRVPPGTYLLAAVSTDYNIWPIPDPATGPVYYLGLFAAPYLYPQSNCFTGTGHDSYCDGVPVEVSADVPTVVPLQLSCQGRSDACGGG